MKHAFLYDLFVEEVQDLYSVEQQIMDALPDMIELASDETLKKSLEAHLEETKKQQDRLAKLGESLDFKADGKFCMGMEGIIKDGKDQLKDAEPSLTTDLTIIAAAQHVEHYEIAGYGTAVNYAQEMGHEDAQKVLHEILEEEKETDEKLTKMAENLIREESE